MVEKKTIFALSSGSGRAGIAVIRMSGPQSLDAIGQLCGQIPDPRRASVRLLRDSANGDVIDEAVVLWLPGPGTVTGEDMAEFHVHGSPAVVTALLRCLSTIPGCVLAEAGAFTLRSFANGKIDLVEAEGLSDLLIAETDVQRQQAMRQFLGETSSVFGHWRQTVLSALAMVEASIDFSDEDGVEAAARDGIAEEIGRLLSQLRSALEASVAAGLVRDGLDVVIAGPPNAGKSSLLNWLARREAAIVSPIAGTTRDVIEVRLVIAGVPVMVSDTAGLRAGGVDAIEVIGIGRAERAAQQADVLIWMTAADAAGVCPPPRVPDLVLLNKVDLEVAGVVENMIRMRNNSALPISIKSGAGMSELKTRLEEIIGEKLAGASSAIVVRERHRVAISESIRILNNIQANNELPLELLAESLRDVARLLGTITGHVGVEDILGEIFSSFCIGK